MLQAINWNTFKTRHENSAKAFEDLCYHLFCRRYHRPDGIRVDYNQTGIETYPIQTEEETVGFQAKFFENKLSDSSSLQQINSSVAKAKATYPELTQLLIYTHQAFGSENPKYKTTVEQLAAPIKIEWVVESNFNALLFQPSNLDLAQLYFGLANEIEFVRQVISPETNNLLQSSYYLELPITDTDNNPKSDLSNWLIQASEKEFILTGNPGSGKSLLMQRLFQLYGGLREIDNAAMLCHLNKQGAIPVLVNLRQCASDSLENILRGRLHDHQLNSTPNGLGFIYLFDGLDELAEGNAVQVLTFIAELSHKATTKKIILSCRSGNLNRLRAKTYLQNSVDIAIAGLDYSYVNKYFLARGNIAKLAKLAVLKKENAALVTEIKDVLLLTLLWEVIDDFPVNGTFIDLFSRKVSLLLSNPVHRKNINELNLLEPKGEKILELNRLIAYCFHKKFQFRFTLKAIQEIIMKQYPRLDHHAINGIVHYLSDLFFDNGGWSSNHQNYIYQHRRYQEFFFAQQLKKEYEKKPTVLRDLRVLSSKDFFNQLFLPYLRSEYEQEGNLVELLGLNLIDVYLGNHPGWGADEAYYRDSKPFYRSLAYQQAFVFEQLIQDDNLQLKEKLMRPLGDLQEAFVKYKRNKRRYPVNTELKNFWEDDLAHLIRLNAFLHRNGKLAFQQKISNYIQQVNKLYRSKKYVSTYEKINKERVEDPFWKEWESYLYYLLVIKGENLESVFQQRIAANYDGEQEVPWASVEENGVRKLLKGFYRVALANQTTPFLEVISRLDDFQFECLLEVCTELEYVIFFIRNAAVRAQIEKGIVQRFEGTGQKVNNTVTFFKRLLNRSIRAEEITEAKKEFSTLENRHPHDLNYRKTYVRCGVLAYIYDRYTFSLFLDAPDESFNYYNALGIYCTLFRGYLQLLDNQVDLYELTGNFHRYSAFYTRDTRIGELREGLTYLWAHIFTASEVSAVDCRPLIGLIVTPANNLDPFAFFLQLCLIRKEFYLAAVSAKQLSSFEDQLHKSEDFFQYQIDQCFDLSMLFSDIDEVKAIDYFSKGVSDGILRHGWRKDYIVSYHLTDALEVILRNEWMAGEQLEATIQEVFRLTCRVSRITDGKGTQHGPYTLIERLAVYDATSAEKLFEKLLAENYWRADNGTIAAIIIAKTNLGLSLDGVRKALNHLGKSYDHEGRVRSDYYFETCKVYLAVAGNPFYSRADQRSAFDSAYDQVEQIQREKYNYVNFYDELRDEISLFQRLCDLYQKQFPIPPPPIDKYTSPEYDPQHEEKFVQQVQAVKTKKGLDKLYQQLGKYDAGVELRQQESWILLVNKTFDIHANIVAFTAFMKKSSFPHSTYFSRNAKYLHFGLAAALANVNTRKEVMEYLATSSGHGGFLNVLRAYEVLRDRKMCLQLFQRFLQFCHLLVD